jgi:transcription elongation factor Elf1
MNSQIKKKIKINMENQNLTKTHFCTICNQNTEHVLNFKSDKTNCKNCGNSFTIDDSTYEWIYKELKKFGVQF